MLPLFSGNAHVIEPPHVFQGRVAQKWADRAPRLVPREGGGDNWLFEGKVGVLSRTTTMGGAIDRSCWTDLSTFGDMINLKDLRPGCYDAAERVRDMDIDGVAVAACTSSPAGMGFGGELFSYAKDPELGLACLRAWNDWYAEEWVAAAPDRFVPIGCPWYLDPHEAAREVLRNAARGFKGVALRNPTDMDLPWFGTGHWDPFLRACEETGTVIVHHTEALPWFPRREQNRFPYGMILSLYQACAMDFVAGCLWGGVTVRFPKLKILVAESGGSWIPHFLRRLDWNMDHSIFTRAGWPDPEISPLRMLQSAFTFSTQELDVAADLRRDLGLTRWMVEDDYPHIESAFPHSGAHINAQLAQVPPEMAQDLAWKTGSQLFDFPMPKESA